MCERALWEPYNPEFELSINLSNVLILAYEYQVLETFNHSLHKLVVHNNVQEHGLWSQIV